VVFLMAWSVGSAAVLAHQGGWDEMLMVAVPIGVFAGLLYAANKRAAKLQAEQQDGRADAGERSAAEAGDQAPRPEPRTPEPRNERAGPL